MLEAADTMIDENFCQAAQRLRDAASAEALVDLVVKHALEVARDILRHTSMGMVAPPPPPHGPSGSAAQLIARVRPDTQPLDAALRHLVVEVDGFTKDLKAYSECTATPQPDHQFSKHRAHTASEGAAWGTQRPMLTKLCSEGRFEEAFQQALKLDTDEAGAAVSPSLVEWLCDLTLFGDDGGTPETFLAREPPPFQSNGTRLALMSCLLGRAVAPVTSLERVELDLEWALCLADMLEPCPLLRGNLLHVADKMANVLSRLIEGSSSAGLADAAPVERQRVARKTRMVAKQLQLWRGATGGV